MEGPRKLSNMLDTQCYCPPWGAGRREEHQCSPEVHLGGGCGHPEQQHAPVPAHSHSARLASTCLQHALCPQVVVLPAFRICRLLWSSVLWGQEGCDGGRSRPGGGGELGDCRPQEQGTPTQWPHRDRKSVV